MGSDGINFHCRAGSEIQCLQVDAGVKWGLQKVRKLSLSSLALILSLPKQQTQHSTGGDWSYILTPVGQQFKAYRWMLKWRGLKFQALIPSLPKNLESAGEWGVMAMKMTLRVRLWWFRPDEIIYEPRAPQWQDMAASRSGSDFVTP